VIGEDISGCMRTSTNSSSQSLKERVINMGQFSLCFTLVIQQRLED
jgi:hypothetical protein